MLLARAGHDVVLVDRSPQLGDVLSTHGIARGGVVQLSRWGLLDAVLATGAPPARQVTFGIDTTLTVRRIKDRAGVDMLLAPRRHVLDALLADAARAAGADVRLGLSVTDVIRDRDGRVAGVTAQDRRGATTQIRARYVVGADGLRSSIARLVGADVIESHNSDAAVYYAYIAAPDWDGFEFHLAQSSFAGVFPTHDGQGCVWLCRPTRLLRPVSHAGAGRTTALLSALAEAAPTVAERAHAGRVASRVRGAQRLPNQLRSCTGPGWALVGDAGYHRDPITGHGITDAFRDAELLATALDRALREPVDEAAALTGYQRARAAALRETFDLTRALAAFPPPHRFAALQIQLSAALDREATMLASMPAPPGADRAVTAA